MPRRTPRSPRTLAALALSALVALTTVVTVEPRAARAASSTSTLAPSTTAQLDLLLEQMIRFGVSGVAAYVDVPGHGTYTGVAGSADFAGKVPMTPDAHFRIGSNTKPVTATVALQLVAEGLLSLDAPISDFEAAWAPVVLPFASQITVRDLLHHTSGIADFNTNPTYLSLLGPNQTFTPQELVGYAAEMPIGGPGCPEDTTGANDQNVQPPAPFCYSNTNYVLLGLIVQHITGNPIDVEVRQRIIEPFGLGGTEFPTTSLAMPAPPTEGSVSELFTATGHVERGPLGPDTLPLVNPSAFDAAGAMISSLADLAVWLPALTDGTLLPPELQQERLGDLVPTQLEFTAINGLAGSATAPSYGNVQYGLGIMKLGPYYGHNGLINGWESVAVRDPTTGVTVVILWNTTVYVDEESDGQQVVTNPGLVTFLLFNVLGILAEPVPGPVILQPTFTG